MKRKLIGSLAVLAIVFASCADSKEKKTEDTAVTEETKEVVETTTEEAVPNIVGVAASNENFTTLVTAVKAGELVDALSGEGPLTVFAPTNDGFGKLPEGTVETLLQPENKATLQAILTYHVVAGEFKAAAVVEAIQANNNAFEVTTLQGESITLSLEGESVVLTDANGNKATVIMTDVAASNGVIHAIDNVVQPKA